MKRDPEAITSRRQFIKDYFKQRKSETPGITLKEISEELSEWYLFICSQTIIKEYRE